MSVGEWISDGLLVLGVLVMTIGVIGLFRMPDVYMQLHAASKAVFLGVIAFLGASVATGDASVIARCVLIAVFLLLTTPIAAHVIAQAAYLTDEPTRVPGSVDESGRQPQPDDSEIA